MSHSLTSLSRDQHGHLSDSHAWQASLMPLLAQELGLTLTPTHEQAIVWLRDYYLQYHHFPTVRFTIKALRQHLQRPDFDSIQLHLLFPQSPLKLMSYCAGLPKPPHCM